MASIAVRRLPTVLPGRLTSIESVPAVAEPVVPEPLLNVMVLPLTVMVSPATKFAAIESVLAAPLSSVAVVIGAGNGGLVVDRTADGRRVGIGRRRRAGHHRVVAGGEVGRVEAARGDQRAGGGAGRCRGRRRGRKVGGILNARSSPAPG